MFVWFSASLEFSLFAQYSTAAPCPRLDLQPGSGYFLAAAFPSLVLVPQQRESSEPNGSLPYRGPSTPP